MQKLTFHLFLTITFISCSTSLLATKGSVEKSKTSQNKSLEKSSLPTNVDSWLTGNEPVRQKLKELLKTAISNTPNGEVVNNLWALSISNQRLKPRPRNNNGKTEFLMVTWVSSEQADILKSKARKKHSFSDYVWVTASPEVKEFCHDCKGSGLDIPGSIMLSLRLQQYLGLRLDSFKTHFVEIWVKENDLFRPCIDQEINDSICSKLPPNISENHSDLINIEKDSAGFPWTGLGYTYDWGNPQKPHIGASEFVIKRNNQNKKVEVEIVAVTPTEKYCNNKHLTVSSLPHSYVMNY